MNETDKENLPAQSSDGTNEVAKGTPGLSLPKTPTDKSNLYWALALIAMAMFFAFGVLLTYLGLTKKFVFNEPITKPIETEESMYRNNNGTSKETTESDMDKSTDEVTEEIIEDIDNLESAEVEGAFDSRELDDLNQ
jgi:hypothetical protein